MMSGRRDRGFFLRRVTLRRNRPDAVCDSQSKNSIPSTVRTPVAMRPTKGGLLQSSARGCCSPVPTGGNDTILVHFIPPPLREAGKKDLCWIVHTSSGCREVKHVSFLSLDSFSTFAGVCISDTCHQRSQSRVTNLTRHKPSQCSCPTRLNKVLRNYSLSCRARACSCLRFDLSSPKTMRKCQHHPQHSQRS